MEELEDLFADQQGWTLHRAAAAAAGANGGGGGSSGGGGGSGGGVSDGGKNLKFLNKIFVGEYQPDSAMASKVTNELNASHRTEKIKTKDKSHRATTEQVRVGKLI